ncbi:MAG: hypothetical protein WC284_17405 [Candidimonas sp.]
MTKLTESETIRMIMNLMESTDNDQFYNGYVEAIFFTNSGDSEDELNDKNLSDFADETITDMKNDCEKFISQNSEILDQAYEVEGVSYTPYQAGIDFWFTRNGHGAGFWDRDLGEIGNKLTKAAKSFKEINPYVGDDGLVYMG